jgi:acetylglutamate kinase
VSILVLKVGGASVTSIRVLDEPTVVVHGAGPQISEEMARRGFEPEFVGGRRVTTPEVLGIVRESFAAVNAGVCKAIGPRALPLFGDEIGLGAQRVPELGLVGVPLPCAPPAIFEALAAGLVPVVAPLAVGPLNVNADEAAAALAVGLGAERLLFLTDVPGVFHEGRLLETIEAARAEALVGAGRFDGGIVPKLLAAAQAARGGLVAEIGRTAVVA